MFVAPLNIAGRINAGNRSAVLSVLLYIAVCVDFQTDLLRQFHRGRIADGNEYTVGFEFECLLGFVI